MNTQYQNDLENSLHYANKKIDELKRQKEELEQYIEMIDDRNSIKLQKVKDDMAKILKKEK